MGQTQAAMGRESSLIGTAVFVPQNQKLGLIKEILFDAQTGQANFVVLDANVPDTGHALIVVPYAALRTSINSQDNRQSFVLDLQPAQLRQAPRISNDQWAMLQNPQFLEQVRNFYQPREYTTARPVESMGPPDVFIAPAPFLVPQPCYDLNLNYGGSPSRDADQNWNDHS
jgi:hypothetical protein